MKTVVTGRVIHDGVSRITIRFPYDSELIKLTKGLSDDRIVPLSDRTIEMVSVYMQRFKPKRFIFEGQVPGRTLQSNQS